MLIKACLNGGTTRAEHPAVPLTPAELAAEASAAAAAGAREFHLHPRSASGEQSLAAEDVLPAVAAVRAATGLPVGVTTGIWAVSGDTSRRLSHVARWTGPDQPDFASINANEPGIDDLADLLASLDVQIEAGVWTLADVEPLAASTLPGRVFRVLLEPAERDPAAAVATASAISGALSGVLPRRGADVTQVHHGYGLATWDVIRWAAARGFDARIGLEDTTVLPDGATAAGNADLVAAAVRLADEAGR